MKKLSAFVVALAMVGLGACSHETKITPEVAGAPGLDRSYTSQAQRQIDDLQGQLDTMKSSSQFGKFKVASVKQDRRAFLNKEYELVGQAKTQLGELVAASDADYSTVRARLENTISTLETDLRRPVAE